MMAELIMMTQEAFAVVSSLAIKTLITTIGILMIQIKPMEMYSNFIRSSIEDSTAID